MPCFLPAGPQEGVKIRGANSHFVSVTCSTYIWLELRHLSKSGRGDPPPTPRIQRPCIVFFQYVAHNPLPAKSSGISQGSNRKWIFRDSLRSVGAWCVSVRYLVPTKYRLDGRYWNCSLHPTIFSEFAFYNVSQKFKPIRLLYKRISKQDSKILIHKKSTNSKYSLQHQCNVLSTMICDIWRKVVPSCLSPLPSSKLTSWFCQM